MTSSGRFGMLHSSSFNHLLFRSILQANALIITTVPDRTRKPVSVMPVSFQQPEVALPGTELAPLPHDFNPALLDHDTHSAEITVDGLKYSQKVRWSI